LVAKENKKRLCFRKSFRSFALALRVSATFLLVAFYQRFWGFEFFHFITFH
jgi:hypothetical protein